MATYLKDDLEIDFGLFSSKISMVSTKVSNTLKKFSEKLNEIEKENVIDEELKEDIVKIEIPADMASDLFSLSENLKNQIFHNSLATSIYSFLEFSLVEYCRVIDNYIEPTKSFLDYKNFGLNKVKSYLKDNFSIDIESIKNWKDVSDFQKIRNLIVHNNANVFKDYKLSLEAQPGYTLLSSLEGIDITSTGTIFIENFDYLNVVHEKVVELINDVIDKTKEEVEKKNETSK